ncbi:AMP-binding protein [Gordonia alkaliphila]|uniref:AMP-binding protein n=1 Tax=Gordonia alkaliphila TaxID=1053547 RepID=UPI001FF506B6|nr:AMP-binding protein [Gordonia alkaliphila]MCK0439274.1 AMP-binding protein [Gordonia alkaliphila]
MQNSWQVVVGFFALAKLGVVALPLNLLLSPSDVAYQLGDSGVQAVLTETPFLPVIGAALAEVDGASVREVMVVGEAPSEVAGLPALSWDTVFSTDTSTVETIVEDRDLLHCLYTSGTTSRPKGVVTSHVAVHVSNLSSALGLGLRPDTDHPVQPIVLPLFHVTALDALLLPTLVVGGTAVLLRGFDPAQVAQTFVDHRVTHLTILPMMWGAVIGQPALTDENTAHLITGLYAMAPMPAPLLVAIMDADGNLLPPNEIGEIVYRSPQLMTGYWNNAAANTEAFAHGWFHGGDIGYLDDEGVVWFTDRAKDIIKTSGENVSSVEVERALLGHPEIAEAAVVGRAHDHWGEAVTAVVVLVPDATVTGEQLRDWAKEQLAGFKAPKQVLVVYALPKTSTGKIQKNLVRTM